MIIGTLARFMYENQVRTDGEEISEKREVEQLIGTLWIVMPWVCLAISMPRAGLPLLTILEVSLYFSDDIRKKSTDIFLTKNIHAIYDFTLKNVPKNADEILAIASMYVSYLFANLFMKDSDEVIIQNIHNILLDSTPLPEALIDAMIIPSTIDSIIDRNIADREVKALMLSCISGLSTIGALKIKSYFIEELSNEDQRNELVGMNSTINNEDV